MWISERLYLREHKKRPEEVTNACRNFRIRTAAKLALGISADPDEFQNVHDWMLSNIPELSLYAAITVRALDGHLTTSELVCHRG